MTIHAIDLVTFAYPHLEIVVDCGKGTYIRSLARDLGQQLGCGGYITSLRRLQVGCFHERDALTLNLAPEEARQHLRPIMHAVGELPRVTLDAGESVRLLHGQRIPAPITLTGAVAEVAVFDGTGRLIAIAEATEGALHVSKNLVGAAMV